VAVSAAALPGQRETSLVRPGSSLVCAPSVGTGAGTNVAPNHGRHGKALCDGAGEVARGLEVVDFACGTPHLLEGAYSENVSMDVDVYSIRQPVGVVAGISPLNFPALAQRASGAWRFPRWSRSSPSPMSWSTRSAIGWAAGSGTGRPGKFGDGPAGVQAAPRQGSRVPGLRRR
jgi:Aldehyde dehydrogenase family